MRQVLVEQGCDIARELYLGIVLDRAAARPVLMVSSEGGVEIEKVAAETPELIFKEHFDPARGLQSYQVRKLCAQTGPRRAHRPRGREVHEGAVPRVCRCRLQPGRDQSAGGDRRRDAGRTRREDDLRRQRVCFAIQTIAELRDLAEEEPAEVRAANAAELRQAGRQYRLPGQRRGLAMSTMDLIKLHGGEPANFLDVGGGADTEQVTEAFRILLDDPQVKAVLVNIFGGIARCTTIANALLEASQQVGFNVPLVVRLEGTEVEEGRRILARKRAGHYHGRQPDRRRPEGRGRRADQSLKHRRVSERDPGRGRRLTQKGPLLR